MASLSRESSVEVVEDGSGGEEEIPGPSDVNHRRLSMRSATRNFRRINFEDSIFYEEPQEEEV